jgi:hypothetical protein
VAGNPEASGDSVFSDTSMNSVSAAIPVDTDHSAQQDKGKRLSGYFPYGQYSSSSECES